MKKKISSAILLTIITLTSFSISANTQKPKFYGFFYGSVMDYFPNIIILKSIPYYTSSTSGTNGNIPERLATNSHTLTTMARKNGEQTCKDYQNYTIDNLNLRSTPFGNYNNLLTELSGNIICFRVDQTK